MKSCSCYQPKYEENHRYNDVFNYSLYSYKMLNSLNKLCYITFQGYLSLIKLRFIILSILVYIRFFIIFTFLYQVNLEKSI